MSQAKGFDISWWQQDLIDFPAAKADGYDWVICRASHGHKKDETFLPNVTKARDVGMVVGAYHYIYVDTGNAQVNSLMEQVNASDGIHTPVFLDVERYSNVGATVAQWRERINKNTKLLEDNGFEVGFYTSYWMWSSLTGNMTVINDKPAENYMMWVAHWSEVSSPSLPIPWNKNPNIYEFWQQGSSLRPEWNHNPDNRTDYGVYNGTSVALRKKYLDEQPPPDTHEELWAAVLENKGRLDAIKKAL